MASQQTLIAETIRGMKLALRRRDDDCDSDTSIHQRTNRGNKLKRKAQFVHEGRLDNTGGRSYRRKIDHAGYQRYIIHQNPPKIDEDGDLVEDDDEDGEGVGSPAEENPFQETKLEYLLAPLTSAAALCDHPSLSIPYTSKHLTEMAENAREMLHKERQSLWCMKRLLERFRGDEGWAPLEKTETMHDPLLLDSDGFDLIRGSSSGSLNDSSIAFDAIVDGTLPQSAHPVPKTNGMHNDLARVSTKLEEQANGIESMDMAEAAQHRQDAAHAVDQAIGNGSHNVNGASNEKTPPDTTMVDGHEAHRNRNAAVIDADQVRKSIEPEGSLPASVLDQPSHAMTTRAKARTPPTPGSRDSQSASPAPSSIPSINHFFIPPTTSLPDRDFGLPASEAEDTRRMLLLYVQKQEEVVRGTEQLLLGLLKADRIRKEVWKWCRAEGHVGEMSDGEDWYDKEQWDLTADLVKGKEEEDVEDEGVRKGRRRRDPKKTAAGA